MPHNQIVSDPDYKWSLLYLVINKAFSSKTLVFFFFVKTVLVAISDLFWIYTEKKILIEQKYIHYNGIKD